VAGLTDTVNEVDLRDHFSQYGRVVEATIQKDRASGESRGFGFVTFESGDGVEKVLQKGSQKLGDKCVVDVKIARPKENPVMAPGGPPGASVWSSTFGPGPAWGAQGVSSTPAWGPPAGYGPPTGWSGPDSYQQQGGGGGLSLQGGRIQGPPQGELGQGPPGGFDGGQFQYGAFQRGRPTAIPRRTFHPYSR